MRIFNEQLQQVRVHPKLTAKGRFSTHPADIAPEKISGVERGTAWQLRRVALLGPHSQRWAEAMLHHRGIEGARVLQGLLSLSNRHENRQIEEACELAQSHGAYRLRVIRELIKRRGAPQGQFEFMQEHPIIRSLSEYDRFVHAVVQEDPSPPIQEYRP